MIADDEADIGDVAKVLLGHQRDLALVDENARRDFRTGRGAIDSPQNAPGAETTNVAMRIAASQRMSRIQMY